MLKENMPSPTPSGASFHRGVWSCFLGETADIDVLKQELLFCWGHLCLCGNAPSRGDPPLRLTAGY